MEFKVDESKIVDYLYDNLSSEDRKKMDEAISNDSKLKKEVNELSKLMEFMGKSEDKEVIPPSFVFQNEKERSGSYFETDAFKWVGSIAASLLLLMLSAYFTGFNVTQNTNGLAIGFGNDVQNTSISKDEVRDIMQEVLTSYNEDQESKLYALESKLSSQLDQSKEENMNSLKEFMVSNTSESKRIMKSYVEQSNQNSREMIADYFKVSTEQQQEYLNTVLTDFSQFYNNQRKEDLETIRTGILDYKNSNDQKQYQTEVVLASLVDMVNTQNK